MPKGSCSVDGCVQSVYSRGWCIRHYSRWRRYGDVTIVLTNEGKSSIDRFWLKVDTGCAQECWVWTGSRNSAGYGSLRVDGAMMLAHRFAYGFFIGAIPDGLTIDHLCRNRACVNPAHLEPVTMRENVLRGMSFGAINARKTHCIHGHLFDEANTRWRSTGNRQCRQCAKAAMERFHAKQTSAAFTAAF